MSALEPLIKLDTHASFKARCSRKAGRARDEWLAANYRNIGARSSFTLDQHLLLTALDEDLY